MGITQYSFKDRAFKKDDQVDQCCFHFALDGTILLKESPEAQDQAEIQDKKEEESKGEEKDDDEVEFDPPEDEKEMPVKNPLRNKFNFSDRAAQTKNSILRERGWATEPPPTTGFSNTVTQWDIFDTYMHEIEQAKGEKEIARL